MAQIASPARFMVVRGLLASLALAGVLAAPVARGTVQATTGSMAAPRSEHTATFLGTGKVLVAGGTNAGGRLATAELFDPATGAFTAAAPMPEARNGHTATLLPNGKVLVAGGSDASGALATCRLYDPRTGAWAATGSMATARREHTATLLQGGKVLVAGGQNGTPPGYTALSSAELYDPATGTWGATGALGSARAGHAAALLEDGTVLVAGGQTRWFPLPALYTATANVYEPGTGTWSATGSMGTARRSFTLTRIPGGLVVAAGGRNASYLSSAERFNVSNGGWGGAGDLGAARSGHAAALLPDARILLVGGMDATAAVGTMAEYSPGTNTWADVETGGARYDHTATLLPGGRVLVVGGERSGWLSDAEIVDRTNPSWTTVATAWGREDGTATLLPNGKVLVLGYVPVGDRTRGALFNPVTDSWASTTGAMIVPRDEHTATLLSDGRVLVVGGRDFDGEVVATAEIYDPATDSFTATPGIDRTRHHAVLLPDGRVLVAGGITSGEVSLFSPKVWSPATATWADAGTIPDDGAFYVDALTLLRNGKVLAVCARGSGWESINYVFDPGAGDSWREPWAPRSYARAFNAVLLESGDVLVVTFGASGGLGFVVYDVETERFSRPFPDVDIPDWCWIHARATTLADGRVLLAGGDHCVGSFPQKYAGVLDPATGITSPLPLLGAVRIRPAMALLPDGRVLVSGGSLASYVDEDNAYTVTSAEVLDPWPTLVESWRPTLTSGLTSLSTPGSFTLSGTGFRGGAEASGGNGGLASAANSPSVLLRRSEGGVTRWVSSSSSSPWSATSFPSGVVSGLPGGTWRATLFSSGLPSLSKPFPVTACELTTGVLESTSAASVCEGQPLVLSARDVAGATYLWTRPDGSTSSGRVLTIPGAQQDDGGLYTVVATKGGCPSPPDSVLVEVAPLPRTPVITAPSELGGNAEGTASVELHPGSTYAWSLSAGTLSSGQGTNAIRFYAPPTGTSMTVTVVETVGASCVQPTAQKTINLSSCSVPTPTPTNTGPYCAGDTIELTTPEVPGATSYRWEGPSEFLAMGRVQTIFDAFTVEGGTYTVRVQVGSCLSAPGSTEVVVNPRPPRPTITAPPSVSQGEFFTASVPAVAGASWSWTVTNGTIRGGAGTREIIVEAGSDGPVTVKVVVWYVATGCSASEASVAIPLELPATKFYPVTPCRLFDTRNAEGPDAGAPALAAGETRTFTVGTRCGLDVATVRSLSVNQTVTQPAADGELVVYRGDLASVPVTSNVSFRVGKTRANNGLLELSRAGDGTFKVHNRSTGTVHFILDVNGVFQ